MSDSELSGAKAGVRRITVARDVKAGFVARLTTKKNSGLGLVSGYGSTPALALDAAFDELDARASKR